MCGFVGIFGKDIRRFHDRLKDSLDLIRYRGPDAEGFYSDEIFSAGHVRLKIIDLSDKANQPFGDGDDDFSLIFNGEIYNYVELIDKFDFSLNTHSDTEVLFHILKKFEDNLPKGLNLLNGMFAFAYYKKRSKKILLCRDRLGVKPLYYTILNNNTVIFASEIKAIFNFGLKFSINHKAVINFFVNRTLSYGEETFFNGIYAIKPGSFIEFYFNGAKLERKEKKYWLYPTGINHKISYNETLRYFREVFFDAVKIRFRADVPVATFLSGGLDSSAITSTAAILFPEKKILSVSAIYEGDPMDEKAYIKEVVEKYKNIEPVWLNITYDMANSILDELIYHQESPLPDGSAVAHFLLIKEIKKYGIKVILSGQGGDEVLGGYVYTFLPAYYADCLTKGNIETIDIRTLFHLLPVSLKNAARRIMIFKNFNKYISLRRLSDVDDYYYKWRNHTILNSYLINSLNYWSLPGFLHYEDRNSMAYSIEARQPFLDYRLVEFLISLPNELKIKNGQSKHILRSALKDILPQNIFNRTDKRGFYAPTHKWLQHIKNKVVKDQVFRKDFGYIDIDNLINNHTLKWRLYTLWRWHRIFINNLIQHEDASN